MDLKKVSKYSIGVVLSLVFLYFAFRGINFHQLLDTLATANYYWLFLFFVIQIISHFIRAWRWKFLINHIKPNVSLKNLFSSIMIGYMVNNFIPRGGEIARPYALGKLENISVSSSLATVIVERVLDVLTLLVLVIFILIYNYELLITNFPWLRIAVIISVVISLCGFGFFIVLSLKTEFAFRIIKKFTSFLPEKMAGKIESLIRAFIEGLLVIKDPKNYFYIFIGTVLLWATYSFQWYVPFYSFNMVHDYSLTLFSAIMLNVIVAIGIMIPVPGSTGTYHAFCIQSLTGLFLVNGATAAAYATVTHAVGIVGSTLVGLYFFMKDNMKLSSITKNKD